MLVGLDSATPPTAAQVAAAKAVGIGMWAGYVSEIPQRDGLYRPWTPAEFDVVRSINPHPIAFTSGWDDPIATRADATNRGYRLCLDVERLIRDDGPWVQAWLDASGAGLYGNAGVHVGRRAAFHIASWYISVDPQASWPPSWPRPATPCGWQWQNTHNEFGVGIDRNWLDPWFGGETDMLTPGMKTGLMHAVLKAIYQREPTAQELTDQAGALNDDGSNLSDMVQGLSKNIGADPNGKRWDSPALLAALDALTSRVASLEAAGNRPLSLAPFDATIIPK